MIKTSEPISFQKGDFLKQEVWGQISKWLKYLNTILVRVGGPTFSNGKLSIHVAFNFFKFQY